MLSSAEAADSGGRLKLNSRGASRAVAIDASVQTCIFWSSESRAAADARGQFSTEIAKVCCEFEFWVFLKNNGSCAFVCEIISILYTNNEYIIYYSFVIIWAHCAKTTLILFI